MLPIGNGSLTRLFNAAHKLAATVRIRTVAVPNRAFRTSRRTLRAGFSLALPLR
jgi:hypothetical protein